MTTQPVADIPALMAGLPSTVAYCQLTYSEDAALTVERIKEADGHVDRIIIAAHDCSKEMLLELAKAAVNTTVDIIAFEFKDNLPEARNVYLEQAKKLRMDWILVSDPDEAFNDVFFQQLKPKIIPALEQGGYNMAGVNCHEQFVAVEWLDDLEKLKESPGGYKESDFWKNLLFRIYPDTAYSGVGTMKNVHETWGSPTVPFKAIALQKTAWYTHSKTALQIWGNAFRNFVIGGGGDNVGDLNPMWTEWRNIMTALHLKGIDDAVRFIYETGMHGTDMKHIVLPWVIKALTFSATDYGTETRESAKFIIYYNRWMLDLPEIKEGIKNIPQKTDDDRRAEFVRSAFFQALGRHPDRKGLENYVKLLREGKLRPQDLIGKLKASPEAKERFREQPATLGPPAYDPIQLMTATALGPPSLGAARATPQDLQSVESVRVNVPVNVDVQITEDTLVQALMQSDTYNSMIKPRLDVGKFVEYLVADPAEFYNKFYEARSMGEMSLGTFEQLLNPGVKVGVAGHHDPKTCYACQHGARAKAAESDAP